ncbi:MAG: UDP-N-acetylmuramoyl-tripeptide--D-alanyl-D-alanine ligase [Clostridia bacterium]|nr:UDP-N-acetylmuramoyl-tripeptide--D-alanyl-D-alanine ligase [Clostridia bacterium]
MTVTLQKAQTALKIANAVDGTLYGSADSAVTALTTDSREVVPGAVFVAIRGETADGHAYIKKAATMGASCILCDRLPETLPPCSLICTDDSVKALGRLAAEYKRQIAPLTVAVTGSIGKTTTKEFIASVLSERYQTLKTPGNFNNHIGLPLTMLSLSETDRAMVVEMGMSARGEIEYLSSLANPKIAVITNIGTSHIEHLGSREGIRDAKMEIVNGMETGGALILNGDEPLLAGIQGAYYVSRNDPTAQFYISGVEQTDNGSAFDLTVGGELYESIVIPAIGEHNVLDAAYAFAVGRLVGMGEYEIRRGLMNFRQTGMRQNLYPVKDFWVLEDCYNAAPESMQAALKVLSQVAEGKGGRKIAVLGEMRELGSYSEIGHRTVGKAAAEIGVDLLFTFGSEAAYIADGAKRAGLSDDAVLQFDTISEPQAIAAALQSTLRAGDTVLFKASRAVALERVIALLK